MRIHVHNPLAGPPQPVTPLDWQDAERRAGALTRDHEISFSDDEAGFRDALPNMEVLLTSTGLVRARFPADAPKLRMIFTTSAGMDRLDPFDMIPPGVALVNNSGSHGAKAAEYALMALLMLANRIPFFATNVRHERWDQRFGSRLCGRGVTIVGVGGLGGPAAGMASSFGLVVTGVRTTPVPHPHCHRVIGIDELDAELPRTELLLLACPLTGRTRNLLSRERIAAMPRGAGIVNIGRGALIDQDALLDALVEGHLGGAVLDVMLPEPIPPGHRLWSTPNLLLTPHMSCDDPSIGNTATLDVFLANLEALSAGRPPPNLVDLSRGY